VFAHRGGAGLRPENTLAAVDHAASLGVDGIEIDVRLSRDGEVVVIHDETLDRTADASGPVSALTASELACVDAGFRFGPGEAYPFRGRGIGIPRLEEIVRRHPFLLCIVELKGVSPELGRAAVDAVRRAGALDRVCFGGYATETVQAARDEDEDACTSATRSEIRRALYASYVRWAMRGVRYAAFQVPELVDRRRIVSPRFVRTAHAAHRLVQVWTVNDEATVRRLSAWGVDGFISDRPDLVLRVVRSVPQGSDPSPVSAPESATARGR
jgi:glycerophosphoryl diester phosphodiesterase